MPQVWALRTQTGIGFRPVPGVCWTHFCPIRLYLKIINVSDKQFNNSWFAGQAGFLAYHYHDFLKVHERLLGASPNLFYFCTARFL